MNPPRPSQSAAHPAVREISREGLREKLTHDKPPKLVMVASNFGFRAKHIPGSLHFHTPEQMFAALGKDEPIVVYCSNADCHASLAVYQRLAEHGYRDVTHYAGGLIDWESAGLPLDGDWVGDPVRS
jgi:rhodanese-related sulfurtransferase